MATDDHFNHELLLRLASMPAYLEQVFAGLAPARQIRNGPDGGFSPVEHVWHLADLERMGFAERIRRLQQEDHPQLGDFEGARIAREGDYRNRSLKQGLEEFRQTRAANLDSLRSLDTGQLSRRGTQQGIGPVCLGDMPSLMSKHDDSHRAEISDWLEAREIV